MEIAEIQAKLKKLHFTPTKSKGQHFLLDESVIETMVSAAEVHKDDLVIEIGPGLGILSEQLTKKAKQVLLIELDKEIAEYIRKEFLPKHPNATLIEGDALSSNTFHQEHLLILHHIPDLKSKHFLLIPSKFLLWRDCNLLPLLL